MFAEYDLEYRPPFHVARLKEMTIAVLLIACAVAVVFVLAVAFRHFGPAVIIAVLAALVVGIPAAYFITDIRARRQHRIAMVKMKLEKSAYQQQYDAVASQVMTSHPAYSYYNKP
jgi:hypothetical protein